MRSYESIRKTSQVCQIRKCTFATKPNPAPHLGNLISPPLRCLIISLSSLYIVLWPLLNNGMPEHIYFHEIFRRGYVVNKSARVEAGGRPSPVELTRVQPMFEFWHTRLNSDHLDFAQIGAHKSLRTAWEGKWFSVSTISPFYREDKRRKVCKFPTNEMCKMFVRVLGLFWERFNAVA